MQISLMHPARMFLLTALITFSLTGGIHMFTNVICEFPEVITFVCYSVRGSSGSSEGKFLTSLAEVDIISSVFWFCLHSMTFPLGYRVVVVKPDDVVNLWLM